MRDLAQSMLVRERTTLEGLRRAVRRLKVEESRVVEIVEEESEDEEEGEETMASGSHVESIVM